MQKVIYKYQIQNTVSKLQLPAGATVLHVGQQEGNVTLWAQVNKDTTALVNRMFAIVGTGYAWEDDGRIRMAHF